MRLTFRQTHLYRFVNMAERVGFEPTEPCGSTDFESESFNCLLTVIKDKIFLWVE